MITISNARQCGALRYEYSFRIYEVLRKNGLNGDKLAKQLGMSRQAVCQVINGINHSQKVLDALREIGVPEEYLFDPRKTI